MRIWRFEFGKWIYPDGHKRAPFSWQFILDHAHCGCYILDIGHLYFTWLGDECYTAIKEQK